MPCSFLIVDADRNFREALAIALRLDGHAVSVAESAEEGFFQLARGTARCCVVDVHLPGSEALLDAAARVGARAVMTGPYADLLVKFATRHPAVQVLPKPFRAAELVSGCPRATASERSGSDHVVPLRAEPR
jgi:DNA-binding NtrC family response regulator